MAVIIQTDLNCEFCVDCDDEMDGIIHVLWATRTRIVDTLKKFQVRCEPEPNTKNAIRCRLACGGEFILFPDKFASIITDWRC